MERKLNLNAVDYAKDGTLHKYQSERLESGYSDAAEYNYTTSVRYLSQEFVEDLAAAHETCEEYGKYDKNDDFIADYTEKLTGRDEELANFTQSEGQIPVICIMEESGEPGDDFIVIYNWDGVLRMTGIHADSHCHLYIYKVNETP